MLLKEEEYQYALKQMEGAAEPDGIFAGMKKWFRERYALDVYGCFCDQTADGRFRLRILLWNRDCRKALMKGPNPDGKKQRKITEEFSRLCRKYQTRTRYQEPGRFLITYDTLEDEIQKRVIRRAERDIAAFQAQDVWKVIPVFHRIHVFFENDSQTEVHQKDGLCEKINCEIGEILRKHDRYGVFQKGVSCIFTSRQTLDEKYDGNLFYYTR